MTNWTRGGYPAGNTPASELKPPPASMISKQTYPAAEPTYTAAEVKVLTEAALRLGRKEAGEEIAQALEEAAHSDYDAADDLHWAAEKALAISSQPSGAVSDATSGVPGHQEVSEAARSPQEPCEDPDCPIVLMHCHPAEEDA